MIKLSSIWITAFAAVGAVLLASSAIEPPVFTEVSRAAGLHATMRCGGPEKRWIPEANGSGVAWIDYDGDGYQDLLIVNGGTMDQLREIVAGKKPQPQPGSVYLFHNLGNGRFEDVTAKAGLSDPYWGTGANVADFDNDGKPDILITNIGVDLLYKNNGDGTFTEIGKQAGLDQTIAWHTGSAFGDFDNDGKLDLFITGYMDLQSMSFAEPAPVCDYFGQHTFCGPIGLRGGSSRLYRNRGDGTFVDVTAASGLAPLKPAHGFTALTGDFNGDGKLDLFVANDSDPNRLFLNKGNLTFEEAGLDQGVAYNSDGRVQSNMGVAAGEYAGSGAFDLLTTTFNKDYFPLFRQDKHGGFQEVAAMTGLATVTSRYLGWACGLTDFSNSGSRDFWTANGHVYPTDKDYFEPVTIFRGSGDHSNLIYSYPQPPNNSYRGGAAADFDNDGRMDLVVVPIAGSPVLLRNDTPERNAWVGIRLRGTRSNRDGIGAKVTIEACGRKQADEERNGGSYISHNDARLHFGLGACSSINGVRVDWPSGVVQTLDALPLNQYSVIEEPKSP